MNRNSLSTDLSVALDLVDALTRAMEISIGAPQNRQWQYASYRGFAIQYNEIVKTLEGKVDMPDIFKFDLSKIPGQMDAVITQHKEMFDMVYTKVLFLQARLANKIGRRTGSMSEIENFIDARLRSGIQTEPTCEKDIQDAIDTLFVGRGMQRGVDYGRETGRVSVSLKEAIPDFVVYSLSLAIEVKFIKERRRIDRIINEIAADITKYAVKYSQIIFVVYDMGHIQDELQFRQGLINPTNVSVRIIIVKH